MNVRTTRLCMMNKANADGGFGSMSAGGQAGSEQSENGLKSCAGGCLALDQELTQA